MARNFLGRRSKKKLRASLFAVDEALFFKFACGEKILNPLSEFAAGVFFFQALFQIRLWYSYNKTTLGYDPDTRLFEVREAFKRALLLVFREYIRAYIAKFWGLRGRNRHRTTNHVPGAYTRVPILDTLADSDIRVQGTYEWKQQSASCEYNRY